jgi:hypothetical protein
MSNGQNVEWDKTQKRHNVESDKGRMGHNVKWDKMSNRNNIEWDKMSNRNNVEWDKTLNDKMSNGTKCRIVYNVEYRLCVIVSMFVTVVCCC